jgi:hypothetical protein
MKLVEEEIWISFDATNLIGTKMAAVLRLPIDLQVGENDGAPFHVERRGVTENEASFDFPKDLDLTEWWPAPLRKTVQTRLPVFHKALQIHFRPMVHSEERDL